MKFKEKIGLETTARNLPQDALSLMLLLHIEYSR